MMVDGPKIWFVTGASSGFGRSMTELLLKKGDSVIATLRRPEALCDLVAQYPAERLLVVKVDVTKKDEVEEAFAEAETTFGRIDVVFNNAGQTVLGEIEGVRDEEARRVMDINFWGASNVTKEAVRFFREVNKPVGGRLLQVSSRMGIIGAAASGYYTASKFALEGFTECLIGELDPEWNIKITLIEPGPFRTKIVKENIKVEDVHPAYDKPSMPGAIYRSFLTSSAVDGDVDKAIAAMERLVHIADPPMRLPLHRRTVASVREKVKSLQDDADRYESWSEDLYVD